MLVGSTVAHLKMGTERTALSLFRSKSDVVNIQYNICTINCLFLEALTGCLHLQPRSPAGPHICGSLSSM
jgi:hypothetical protein